MDWAAEGLGLQYGSVRLARTRPSWADIGSRLAADVWRLLGC